ncbi:hypothetical protein EL26_07160 [Tumebacillus flagellatus]|uniref:Uncharacterized protein n=2 Tax=Tumebacillus flagellatus TaxID=1157490 RepID=A0A074LS59_9BACL|nr:hypothetical protein EL26_07160 [Tumebacillus flagellatus]
MNVEHIDILDTNIEAFLYTVNGEYLTNFQEDVRARRLELESKPQLNGLEQVELLYLVKACAFDYEGLEQAIQVMRNENLFYDYHHYQPAVELLLSWVDLLSLQGFVGQFDGFSLSPRSLFNLQSSGDMGNHELCHRIANPFHPYFENVLLPLIQKNEYRVVGINVTYMAQLPFALSLGRLIRNHFPNIVILFGGTEVSDVWKYLLDKSKFFCVFDAADACVIGEGEQAFTQLLKLVENNQPFRTIANVLFNPKHELTAELPVIQYEDIAKLPTPDYSQLDWSLYLSPEPFVYYSPSRGCYWNKCTFCDYGLNGDSPTSPWRTNQVDKVVDDLSILSKKYKFIYFSVDVLSPATLLHLAEEIVKRKIDIRWGAEIRLEKYWSKERCDLLKASGCTAISVGFESGNQRILDLINKGTQVHRVKETVHSFYNSGIGVQIMGFTHFPSERYEEAMDSINFLMESRDYWTFGGLGTFALTPGAIVAKQPSDFGITNVRPYDGDDIIRNLHFEDSVQDRSPETEHILSKKKQALNPTGFDRPWVGGTDSAHSFFYHDRFGTQVRAILEPQKPELDTIVITNGNVVDDIGKFPIEELLSTRYISDLHAAYRKEQLIGLSHAQLVDILTSKVLPSKQGSEAVKQYFIRQDNTIHRLTPHVIELLEWFQNANSLRAYFEDQKTPEADRHLFERLLHVCILKNYIRFVPSPHHVDAVANHASSYKQH